MFCYTCITYAKKKKKKKKKKILSLKVFSLKICNHELFFFPLLGKYIFTENISR